ncbi:MAG TPA: ABC transporter permease [Planctomycetaceae bacterium]
MLRLIRTVQLALKSLLLHKLRSGLTMLGIVFGVFSVIAMLSIGEGASKQAQQQVLQLGATNVIAVTVKPPAEADSGSGGRRSRILVYGLTRDDFDARQGTLPSVTRAVPIRETTQQVRRQDQAMIARVVGCTAAYRELNHLSLARGRFITDRDQERLDNVCVLAYEVAEQLFRYDDPLNQAVRIGNQFYTVVGVMKPRGATSAIGGSLAAQDYSKDIYIPIRTFQARLGDLIILRQAGSSTMEQVELNQITLQIDDPANVIPTAEAVRETLQRTHDKQDWSVVVPMELLRQADQIRQIFNIVLGSIAAISLVVGGIGIMNIMLATVTERTREIGIRRALGAKQKDILQQFLTETVVLAGTGGVIGILLGLATPPAFAGMQYVVTNFVLDGPSESQSDVGRMFTEMEPTLAVWSLPLAFLISVGIGVVFGVYPARAAARMDPIEALRHE